jgi:hypothetical protein
MNRTSETIKDKVTHMASALRLLPIVASALISTAVAGVGLVVAPAVAHADPFAKVDPQYVHRPPVNCGLFYCQDPGT